jgi:prepilin-type processing-associated H-X9-DG protein
LESPFQVVAAPGARSIDLRQAKLFPYIGATKSIEGCPSFDYRGARCRPKYDRATDGYGLNYLLFGRAVGTLTNAPALTVWFADAVNVNTIQAPASSANPLLEEFYFVHPYDTTTPTTHFRHSERANVVFGDGHVEALAMAPGTGDGRRPEARVGRLNTDGDWSLFW